MLNETYELSRSLRAAGITADSWFNNYKKIPNYRTFLLLIGSDGSISDLEPVSEKERVRSFRKWEIPNQGISFPAISVPPLFYAKSKDAQDSLAALRKKVANVSAEMLARQVDELALLCEKVWDKSEIDRINKCIQSRPKELAQIIGPPPEDFKSLEELIRRAPLLNADRIGESVRSVVIRRMGQSPGDARTWLDALLVSTAKIPKQVTLVLELVDMSSFKYPANHEKVQQWINSRLIAGDKPDSGADQSARRDAFSEPITDKDSNDKFPEVRLPTLGNVKLRSMNKESPCQTRYGHIDTKSFPAGKDTRQAMKDALEWLGDTSRRGKTWQNVSGTCGFTKRENKKVPVPALLFAYPLVLPADPPELAEWLVGQEERSGGDEAKYEKCAERVMSALKLIVQKHPETEIRVFVLAKADKARTKLVVSKRYEAKRLIESAQLWRSGCDNVPTIKLNLGVEDNPKWVKPFVPFPGEVVKCLNLAWLQGGTRTDSIHGLGIGEGLALLMQQESASQSIAERALRLTISNTAPLLLTLGHVDHRQDGSFNLSKDNTKYASLLPSLIGLLLHKLNYTKGGYMASAPFLVGQMLALADTLHKEYCQHVRKGESPPQLIGNALMPVALGNPAAGFARLSERIIYYQAWANTVVGDNVGLAKWTLHRLGQVSDELSRQALPESCDDAQKAQMLLGYLARPEKDASN